MSKPVEVMPIDSWLATLRLANFCPTSLSIDDLHGLTRLENGSSSNVQYIPPSPSVSVEKIGTEPLSPKRTPRRNRFDFLLSDVKIEEAPKQRSKMQYELSNMTRLRAPGKIGDSLIIVSLSSSNLSKDTPDGSYDQLDNVSSGSDSMSRSGSDSIV
ncbi:hypothetical protein GPJ56_001444 [Histomonas meleagridis]|uniref:uncharacterized protein n=1 Tax=Histomonas meleagridis TaxID=135588 RepID=UPI00355AC8E9|nr:hypothetical protein GPJ56_001444 [Histomonas meleagridis]KAH0798204.1 hypothetical protein GO595_009050 [Histomonas meleagridis]